MRHACVAQWRRKGICGTHKHTRIKARHSTHKKHNLTRRVCVHPKPHSEGWISAMHTQSHSVKHFLLSPAGHTTCLEASASRPSQKTANCERWSSSVNSAVIAHLTEPKARSLCRHNLPGMPLHWQTHGGIDNVAAAPLDWSGFEMEKEYQPPHQ